MEVHAQNKGGQLTITLSGRIDAAEAQKLQKELMALVDEQDRVDSIVIDATHMAFISSMGLRVMLMLKKRVDDLRIIGVNQDVYNVFAMTGFHKILTIEKALPEVSVEGCPAVNGQKDVYQLTDDTVLKVYAPGTAKAVVDHEVEMTKEMFVMGVPTAMAFDVVMVEGRYGLIYESTQPMRISAIDLGTMLRNLHEQKVDPEETVFVYGHQEIRNRIDALEPYLGDDAVSKLQQMMKVLPDATSLLHGNLTLDCIMKQNNEAIFTGMGSVCYGHPVLDLSRLYASLTEEQRGEYFDMLLDEYFDMESAETIKRNRENIVILSSVYEFLDLLDDGEPSPEAVEASKARFKECIADRWEEILSRLRFKMDFNEEIRALERKQFYLDPDVNIDWIAQKLGTNRHYVSDYFNKVLHCTFNEYINNLRLNYAARLIREGRVAKSQICYDAGFGNDHTFRRLFKQKFGCLPSQYKG
ncbi:MAG: anti-sigma factor antagonist [Bacteroidaceae bacterium]|nr:anti-sigma factor antagonist [Bacteroidaceae bacterium]